MKTDNASEKRHAEDTTGGAEKKPTNRFRVLRLLKQGDLTLNQASELLTANKNSTVLRWLATYGKDLSFLEKSVDELQKQHLTRYDRTVIVDKIAERLGVTRRQVNKITQNDKLKTPSPYYEMLRQMNEENAKVKRRSRFEGALAVIAGSITMDGAADEVEVSSRQMYRHVTNQLARVDLTVKDLKHMTIPRRVEISEELREKGPVTRVEQ